MLQFNLICLNVLYPLPIITSIHLVAIEKHDCIWNYLKLMTVRYGQRSYLFYCWSAILFRLRRQKSLDINIEQSCYQDGNTKDYLH